ncbi:MAG: DUF3187 family protein [Acidobacteriota bacterium]
MAKVSLKSIFFIILFCLSTSIFPIDVEYPLVQSFTHFPYSENEVLKEGEYSFYADLLYSNVFMFDVARTTFNDMELFSGTFGFRYSISDSVNLELYNKSSIFYGGVMDLFIMDFHEAIGLKRGARENFERNEVNYYYKDLFFYEKNLFVNYPIVFGFLTKIYDGYKWDINFRASFGLPVSSREGLSSEKPFLTTGVIFLYRNGDLSFDLSNYVSFYKKPEWAEFEDIRTKIFMVHIKGVYKRFFAGLLFRSTPFKVGDISNPAFQMYFGVKISDFIEFSLVEEFPPMDTVPDFSFRLTFRFGSR